MKIGTSRLFNRRYATDDVVVTSCPAF